jgi:hypothetical protein
MSARRAYDSHFAPGLIMTIRTIAIVFVLSLVACSSLRTRAPQDVDLTGIWDLDAQDSDSPGALVGSIRHEARGMRHRRGGRRDEDRGVAPGGIGQGPGGGFPIGRPAGIRGGGPGATGMHGGWTSELGAREMDIEQRKDSTRIEYDGRDMKIYDWGANRGNRGKVASGWDKNDFVIKAEDPAGRGIERRFVLSADRKVLTVVTTAASASITQRYELDEATTRKVYGGPVAQ